MSMDHKIKVENLSDVDDPKEFDDLIVNNVKQEPEKEYLLVLPPPVIKIEKIEVNLESKEEENEKFQCKNCPKLFDKKWKLNQHFLVHKFEVNCQTCSKIIQK